MVMVVVVVGLELGLVGVVLLLLKLWRCRRRHW